jgi:hypothetical protein
MLEDDTRTKILGLLNSAPTTWAAFQKWFDDNKIGQMLPRNSMIDAEFTSNIIAASNRIKSGEAESVVVPALIARLKALSKPSAAVASKEAAEAAPRQGSGRGYKKSFERCVKSVRKSVKARKGSTKESAAIAICTKSVLHTRGKTIKRYRKGRLVTQKRFH